MTFSHTPAPRDPRPTPAPTSRTRGATRPEALRVAALRIVPPPDDADLGTPGVIQTVVKRGHRLPVD
jgi:hypothetical protein